jgi:hypothetical protein
MLPLPSGAFQQPKNKPPAAPPAVVRTGSAKSKPSIDALLQRVEEYWRLLAQGKKSQATIYVEASCRSAFSAWQAPAFSKPRLAKLELSASGAEVRVTMLVKRALVPLSTEVDWTVANQWVFLRGNWWLAFKDESRLAYGKSGAPGATAKEVLEAEEKARAALRSRFTFDRNEFDLGTIRKGTTPEFTIGFSLAGDTTLEAALDSKALDIVGLSDGVLTPGRNQKIRVQLLTPNLEEGPLREKFSILVREDKVIASFDFILQANVYATFSVVPRIIRLRPGETEADVEIRNNSSVEAGLVSSYSEYAMIDARPLPQSLPPGGSCRLKVRLLRNVDSKNLGLEVGVKLSTVVENIASLIIPVVVNFVEEPKKKAPAAPSEKEIQELIRKARPDSPRP